MASKQHYVNNKEFYSEMIKMKENFIIVILVRIKLDQDLLTEQNQKRLIISHQEIHQ